MITAQFTVRGDVCSEKHEVFQGAHTTLFIHLFRCPELTAYFVVLSVFAGCLFMLHVLFIS